MDTYFHLLDISQKWGNVENEAGLQVKLKLTFSSYTGP